MSFELFTTITAYGNQIGFHTKLDENLILNQLKEFDNDWTRYNPRVGLKFPIGMNPGEHINNRWGLSITNINGKLGAGPDLDSLHQYNRENDTNYKEEDFTVKTPVYDMFEEYFAPFEQWLFRCHIIQLRPGGFFPPHVDNYGRSIESFRLFIPLKNCNPPNHYFIEDNQILYFQHGRVYFMNTCKQHLLFNPLPSTTIFIVLNVKLNEDSVDHFLTTEYLR